MQINQYQQWLNYKRRLSSRANLQETTNISSDPLAAILNTSGKPNFKTYSIKAKQHVFPQYHTNPPYIINIDWPTEHKYPDSPFDAHEHINKVLSDLYTPFIMGSKSKYLPLNIRFQHPDISKLHPEDDFRDEISNFIVKIPNPEDLQSTGLHPIAIGWLPHIIGRHIHSILPFDNPVTRYYKEKGIKLPVILNSLSETPEHAFTKFGPYAIELNQNMHNLRNKYGLILDRAYDNYFDDIQHKGIKIPFQRYIRTFKLPNDTDVVNNAILNEIKKAYDPRHITKY